MADAILAESRLSMGLICDGIHASPIQARILTQLPKERLFLETDSVKFTGLDPGKFELDPGKWVYTSKDNAARDESGMLSGSILTVDKALRNLIRYTKISLSRASWATSLMPAKLAGVESDLGSLEPGKQADIALLDKELKVVAT
jgi:N-acetylglucosamine-6-phosphate deacetylase